MTSEKRVEGSRVTEVCGAHVTFDLDGNEIAVTTHQDASTPLAAGDPDPHSRLPVAHHRAHGVQRAVTTGEWLSESDLSDLPDRTLIYVEWSGGNRGTYVLVKSGDLSYALSPLIVDKGPDAVAHALGWADALTFIGTERPFTRVRVCAR